MFLLNNGFFYQNSDDFVTIKLGEGEGEGVGERERERERERE